MAILARDVMNKEVISVRPSILLTELEDALIARHISGVPVVDKGRLVGIVSRSDIVRYFSLQRTMADFLDHEHKSRGEESPGRPSREEAERTLTVSEIMAKDPVAVAPDAPIEDVAKRMVARHVHRVVVTEGETVVGIISALDVVQLIVDGRMLPK
jgi:CBS domain-containing protein